MADMQIKKAAFIVLEGMEKVSSFAATINPLFNIVTAVVRVAKKGVETQEVQKFDEHFKNIHAKLDTISQKHQQILNDTRMQEMKMTHGEAIEGIKNQYSAFKEMVEQINKNPEDSKRYTEKFKEIIEKDGQESHLDSLYRGIATKPLFERNLLDEYFEIYEENKEKVETKCLNLIQVFYMGLMAIMAYLVVIEDDTQKFLDKWNKQVKEIEDKMKAVVEKCTQN